MKNFAFFDVDNTIYDGYSTPKFILFLSDNKLIPRNIRDEHDEIVRKFISGKIDYEEAVIKAVELCAQALKGQTVDTVNKWKKDFAHERNLLFPWVNNLFSLLKNKDYKIYFISGSARPAVES